MERNTNPLYILRFLAAITVVLYHFTPASIYGVNKEIGFLIKNGGEAVNFFFFISGFVMIISNTKNYFASDSNNFSTLTFYIKRFARIYPLYFFALLAQAVFHYGIHSIDTPTVKYRLPFEILGIQRWLYAGSFNSPDWTVSCEFFFYLFFPFIIIYMRKNMKRFTIFVLAYFVLSVAITSFLYFLTRQPLSPIGKQLTNSLFRNPLFLISTFLFGMLCGKLYLENKLAFFKNRRNSILSVIFSVIVIFSLKYYINPGLLTGGILCPFYFILVSAITSFKNSETAVFNSTLFIFLGDISFGVYILQSPVNNYYSYFAGKIHSYGTLLFFVLTLIIICSITYYIIEIPLKKMILSYYDKRVVRAKKKAAFQGLEISEKTNPIL
jgi:peptidoglycan/LPS O-acetylase OafA/YrhL